MSTRTTATQSRPKSDPPLEVEPGWYQVGSEQAFPADAGIAVLIKDRQVAVYYSAEADEWFATDNHCPHAGYAVLARGLLGDARGEPKVACPMHKRAYSLRTGKCLSGDESSVQVFDVRVREGQVEVRMP